MDDKQLAWFNGFYAGFYAHRDRKLCRHGYGPGDHHWEQGTCLSQDAADAAVETSRCSPSARVTDA